MIKGEGVPCFKEHVEARRLPRMRKEVQKFEERHEGFVKGRWNSKKR